jgi:hypothetical protein
MSANPQDDFVNVVIDGVAVKAKKGAMIIHATDQNGRYVPRFCYHDKLPVAANCRMCLVEVEKAPKPLPACATPVAEGMKIFTRSPNALAAQNWNWHVPLQPAVAASSTAINTWFGTVGFTTTGIPIYAAMEGAQPASEAFGDPIYNGIVDTCKGHTGPAKEYHVHALNTATSCGFGPSPIVGYALDGFPIYGSQGCLDTACTQVVTFKSGWVKTGDPKTNAWSNYTYQSSSDQTVLDKCNGRVGPDGTYRYYVTASFPYTFGCFKGTPTTQSGAAGGPMPPM